MVQPSIKHVQNIAKKLQNDPRQVLLKAQKALNLLLTEYLWVVIVLVLLFVSYYIKKQISKKEDNDYYMEKAYKNLPRVIGNINSADVKYKLDIEKGTGHLRDYYIASSYNSCCSGDFQDSYVSLVPLKEVILQGARVLDFSLYLLNDDVVVAASPTESDNIKGTYNSLPVGTDEGILATINRYAFSAPCPNPTDPLFLHFRIKSKSNPRLFYKKLTKYVRDYMGSRLLPPEYGFEGRHDKNGNGINLAREPILNLRNRVIIICHQESNNFRGTSFEEFVNLSSGSPFFQTKRNYDIQYGHNMDQVLEYNKKNITISMPDYSALNDNLSPQLHFHYGCQMVCMNYANLDSNMNYYRDMFNNEGSAFVLKPDNQRYRITTVNPPKPPNPKTRPREKRINLPMASFSM